MKKITFLLLLFCVFYMVLFGCVESDTSENNSTADKPIINDGGNDTNTTIANGDNDTDTTDTTIDERKSLIAAGIDYSLAIDEDGNLWAWGYNGFAQLGTGDTSSRYFPVQIEVGTKFTSVAAGGGNFLRIRKEDGVIKERGRYYYEAHSLAIDKDGNLWAWGSNGNGQRGDASYSNIVKVGTKFTSVTAGYVHSLAIDEDGNLWVWGKYSNNSGTNTPFQIKEGTKFIIAAAGGGKRFVMYGSYVTFEAHSLAIDEDGNLWAWGDNNSGQLGNGNTTGQYSPVQVKSGTKFITTAAGVDHSLAIDENGNLWAWGNNNSGQLGNGTKYNASSPIQIKSGTKFITVAAGGGNAFSNNGNFDTLTYSLAIDEDGNLWGWGNSNGNVYVVEGKFINSSSPIQIKAETKFIAVVAGVSHFLAMDKDGNLWVVNSDGISQAPALVNTNDISF